jgi:hypothetical protein
MLLRSAGVAFLSATGLWHESAGFKRTPKSWRPDGLVGVSVLQQFGLYKFFYVNLRSFEEKCGERASQVSLDVARGPHGGSKNLRF